MMTRRLLDYLKRRYIARQELLMSAWETAEDSHPGLYTRQRDAVKASLARLYKARTLRDLIRWRICSHDT